MKTENKYYFRISCSAVIIFLAIFSPLKIYSQAQAQGLLTEGRNNLCTPHTNKPVDSPSTHTWANLSAPVDSATHLAEPGALQKFTSVKHEEIYTNVDAVVLMKNNSLRSEFIVKPGAEMHHIMLTYNRARNIKIKDCEELVHDGEFRRFAINEPVVYQLVAGDNHIINAQYDIDRDGIVSFEIEEFDKSLPLFIVPSTGAVDEFTEYNLKLYDNGMLIEMARLE